MEIGGEMTPEQQIVFVQGQIACSLIEMEAMKAANIERANKGESLAYGEADFMGLIDKHCISHNGIISNF